MRCESNGLRNRFRRISKSVLEIGAHRQICRRSDRRNVLHHLFAAHCAIGLSEREGITSAGGGQSLKSDLAQETRRPHLPGIRNHQSRVALVKSVELSAFFVL